MMDPVSVLSLLALGVLGAVVLADGQTLPGTEPLKAEGDLAAQMVAGMDRFLMRELDASVGRRAQHWRRDLSSPEAYARSVAANRQRFAKIIGAVDARGPAEMVRVEREEGNRQQATGKREGQKTEQGAAGTVASRLTPHASSSASRLASFSVHAVRWGVLKGVEGEGLLLIPEGEPVADVVALGDCDWTPEQTAGLAPGVPEAAQLARRLAERGCRVLVPVLIDRKDTYSEVTGVRKTNQPHREFIYRAAYEMGRHIIGYEAQKVLAGVDWFVREGKQRPVGVIGYGEGGLIAFYAGALDVRVDVTVVSGYFGPREGVWQEPIYRNVWGLLEGFGDAEVASLIAPRGLVVEACGHPEVTGPPPVREGRSGGAPGVVRTPEVSGVEREFARAQGLVAGLRPRPSWALVKSGDGGGLPGSEGVVEAFVRGLVGPHPPPNPLPLPREREGASRALSTGLGEGEVVSLPDPEARLKRQFDQLVEHTQHLMREAEFTRAGFWSKADASSVERWRETTRWYRDYFREEVIGSLPPAQLPAHPRTRLVYEEPKFRGYEVVLDVYEDVFAYGILLVPKDLKAGERRPVVVCQHGLEGRPQDVADPKVDNPSYHRFACQLAERGFITYAPQNPYIGGDRYRVLQRKANPLKRALFSFIVRQHERTLAWLSSLAFVDPERIAFYGLSYGGSTAMRVPAMLEGYCLSICSACYNEWVWKSVSVRRPFTYPMTGEFEQPEFDLGNTFNHAEMSWLIFPRPFMVERGHQDGVAPDEWVAYEYTRTFRRYSLLGLRDRTEIAWFNGPHTIHGVETFAFLHKHLNWPEP